MARIFSTHFPDRDPDAVDEKYYLADDPKEAAEKADAAWCHRNAEFADQYVEVKQGSTIYSFTVEVVSRPELVAREGRD